MVLDNQKMEPQCSTVPTVTLCSVQGGVITRGCKALSGYKNEDVIIRCKASGIHLIASGEHAVSCPQILPHIIALNGAAIQWRRYTDPSEHQRRPQRCANGVTGQ
uniref:Uncharacterized protein n=1 Tax=Eutreptiella gymnastica TaxID=73025 RepID=A0A7S4D0U7_9EUGL